MSKNLPPIYVLSHSIPAHILSSCYKTSNGNTDGVVSIVSRLWGGRLKNRDSIPGSEKYFSFSLFENVQTSFRARPESYQYTGDFYDRMTVHRDRFLVNKTNRCTDFQFYWYYYSTCFGQPFSPSSGVLSGTSALAHFMQL